MKTILAFLKRDLLNQVSYRLSFLLQILGIFPIVLVFFYLSRLITGETVSNTLGPYGGAYFPFVLIGISVQNYLTISMNNFSTSIRDSQLSGTLEAVLSAPVSLPQFLIGSAAYSFIFNSLRIAIYVAFGLMLANLDIHWSHLPVALLVIILTILAFSSLGIFSASFIIYFKKGDPINWGVNVLSWLLGGVYFPIIILPDWLQKVSFFIPMTHSLEALRISLLGGVGNSGVVNHVIVLFIWVLVGLPLSILCFHYALQRARVTGTLGHY